MFHNVKIVGNRNIPLCLAEFKDLSASNAMVHINLKTIVNLVSVAKPMKRLTHLTSKQKKSELCLYIFKCANCHGDHQVDSNICVKIVNGGLYFIFSYHFYFTLLLFFFFIFLFLEQLGLGFISHAVTSVTN